MRTGPEPGSNPFGSRLLGPADQAPRALRVRIQVLLTVMLLSTNIVGAIVAFLISNFALPAPRLSHRLGTALAVAVPAYVLVAVVVGAVSGTSTTLKALRWALDDHEPDEADRERALRAPLRLTVTQVALWLIAAVLFTVLCLVFQPSRALPTGSTVVISAVVVGAIAYLLTQFTLRPVAARALAASPLSRRPRGAGVADRMVILWCLGTGTPLLGAVLAAILTLAGVQGSSADRLAGTVLVISGVVLVFGLFVTVLNARSVVEPVLSVRDALLDVEHGDFDRGIVVYDGTELGQLQAGFNEMVSGLREREELRDLFGRHVGKEVARAAAAGEIDLGGESREVSVLFVDLAGSTSYATEHEAAQVVAMLNRFFGVVVDEVEARDGLINKFIGDAVLAIFGAPVDHPDHAAAALAAARATADRLAVEVPEIGFGIGVATGFAVAGNVGHQDRFEYTVIGDVVNSAARLTDLAKKVPGRVLVAWDSVEAAPGEAAYWRQDGERTLRGRPSPTGVGIRA